MRLLTVLTALALVVVVGIVAHSATKTGWTGPSGQGTMWYDDIILSNANIVGGTQSGQTNLTGNLTATSLNLGVSVDASTTNTESFTDAYAVYMTHHPDASMGVTCHLANASAAGSRVTFVCANSLTNSISFVAESNIAVAVELFGNDSATFVALQATNWMLVNYQDN